MNWNKYNTPSACDSRTIAQAMRHVFERERSEEHKREYLSVDELSDVMACFWKEVVDGEREVPESMVTGICAMVNAMLDARMEHEHTEYDAELHRRYKEAIENIREAPNMQEKERLMKEYFGDDLTSDEQVVLRDKATAKSYKQRAREKWGSNGSAERWMAAGNSLKHKYTNK